MNEANKSPTAETGHDRRDAIRKIGVGILGVAAVAAAPVASFAAVTVAASSGVTAEEATRCVFAVLVIMGHSRFPLLTAASDRKFR